MNRDICYVCALIFLFVLALAALAGEDEEEFTIDPEQGQ